MGIEQIKKIYLFGHKEIETPVIDLLQSLGVIEVSELLPEYKEKAAEKASLLIENKEVQGKKDELEYIINFLKKNPFRDQVVESLGSGKEKITLTESERDEIIKGFDLEKAYQNCKILERKLEDLKIKRGRLEAERLQIAPWLALPVKLSQLISSAGTRIRIGHVLLTRYPQFKQEILAVTDESFLYEVNADKKYKYIILIYSEPYASQMEEILKRLEFTSLYHPLVDLSPQEISFKIDRELEDINKQKDLLVNLFKELISWQRELKVLYDYYSNLQLKDKIRQIFIRTNQSFCLTGWIPEKESNKIRETLLKKFSYLEVIFTDPENGDNVPIILKNKLLAESSEVVTSLYGLPNYWGIDPTPYLSVFFLIFFGLCITDAGYGIVLMLITGYMLWKRGDKMGEMTKKFSRLFFLGGFSTLLFGAMVGGWFGVTVKFKLFDPLEDIFIFFALSLGLGLLHIFTALSIKMSRGIKSGDLAGALADQGLWISTLSSLVCYGLSKSGILPSGLVVPAKVWALSSTIGIAFFQGRSADKNLISLSGLAGIVYPWLWVGLTLSMALWWGNVFWPFSKYLSLVLFLLIAIMGRAHFSNIFGRIGLGLYSLYSISGFLGDTLSYTRLVALGLTTGIVGMVLNKLAAIAYPAPYVGVVIAFFILLGGHTFNLAINLLGAFVHSCRLQYVEFFNKFYESGGKAFKPFRIENKYTLLPKLRQ